MTTPGSEAGESDLLARSQQAIDEGHEAAREALSDMSPADELDVPATGDGLESNEEDVAPRPN
jgi:hypothetical protein